eukprot:TRINITY_DN614_c0_g2_i1.p1 TRINITY_DN614_c0_g2~~TRINITY_DN614_c0_g2_i1.p1  ORF type:complete len:698 (-),score=224.95 TRINITY_DN614_c0_g2_i1:74-2167(-)
MKAFFFVLLAVLAVVSQQKKADGDTSKVPKIIFDDLQLSTGSFVTNEYQNSVGAVFSNAYLGGGTNGKYVYADPSVSSILKLTITPGFTGKLTFDYFDVSKKRRNAVTVRIFQSGGTLLSTYSITDTSGSAVIDIGNQVANYVEYDDAQSYIAIDNIDYTLADKTEPTPNSNDANQCTTVCTNSDNGLCVVPQSQTTGFCACYSGFKGYQCEKTPSRLSPSFDPPSVDVNQDIFAPVFTTTILDTTVELKITIPSAESISNKGTVNSYSGATYLTFGGNENKRATVDSKCDYPRSTAWELETIREGGEWKDTYTGEFSFSDLHACGLTKASGYPSGFAIYNATLDIERDFTIGNGKFEVVRTNTVEQKFAFLFPHIIVAVQQITVAPGPEVFASWSEIKYDRMASEWHLSFTTVSDQVVLDWPTGGPSDPQLKVLDTPREFSYTLTPTNTGDCSATNAAGADCTQEFTIKIKDCHLIKLNGYNIPMKLKCKNAAANCVDGTFSVTLSLETTAACPISQEYDVSASIMPTLSRTLYGSSETVTFGVKYTLPTAISATHSVSRVCAYPKVLNAPSSPPPCSDSSKYVDLITSPAPTNPDSTTYKGVFAINAGQAKEKSGVTGTNEIVVQADLILTYSGISKRSAEGVKHAKTSTFVIKLEDLEDEKKVKLGGEFDRSAASSSFSSVAFCLIGLLALLFI